MSDAIYKGEDFDDKVRKQVEFYFSDSNLQLDKFLWKIYEANDGWVELKTILTFSRMRQFRPEEKVVEALRALDKLVVSENGELIKRKAPVPDFDAIKQAKKKNTVHIEGFPETATQDELELWFSEKITPNLPKEKELALLRLVRRREDKKFFGVVDVEFALSEDATWFLELVEVAYPQGIVTGDSDKKDHLKKMSLLAFRELRETLKRFGVNDVTKRRNSFNDKKNHKKRKFEGKKEEKADEQAIEDTPEASETAGAADAAPAAAPTAAETTEAAAEATKGATQAVAEADVAEAAPATEA